MEQLLIKIKPYNHESILGFLYRLSRKNFYSSPRCFFGLLNGKYPDLEDLLYSNDLMTLIDNRTGYEQRELNELTIFNFSVQYLTNYGLGTKYLSKLLIPKRQHRFCPLCLREKNYHRIYWLLVPYTICHEHQVYMKDKCPGCNKFLSFSEIMKGNCACGTNLKEVEPWPVERQSHIEMGKLISEKILSKKTTYNEQLEDIFQGYNSLSFIYLLYVFVNILKYYRTDSFEIELPDNRWFFKNRTKRFNGYVTPYIVTELYVLANKLISKWPENLWLYLDEFKDVHSSNVHEIYGRLVNRLKKDLIDYNFIWNDIRKYFQVDYSMEKMEKIF